MEELETKGLTFEEIVAKLRRKYSRQTEQVWADIASLKWADCATSQEFLMKFGTLHHELKQVTAKEQGVIDQTRLTELFRESLTLPLKVALASAGTFNQIDDLIEHFEQIARSARREVWTDRPVQLSTQSRPY